VPVIKTGPLLVVAVAVAVELSEVLLEGSGLTLALSLVVGEAVATGTSVLDETAEDSVVEESTTEEMEDSVEAAVEDTVEDGVEEEDGVGGAAEDVVFRNGPSVGSGAGSVFVLAGTCVVTTGAAGVVGIETTAI
jgi:hypothetical protein